jgi:N-acetylmuramoyl-L-alanine amidase
MQMVEYRKHGSMSKRKSTDYIVVHCAATKPSMDIGRKDIDQWHRQRGWLKIGYHFVIRRNGEVEIGRAIDEVGAHVLNRNSNTVGVCLVGGIDEAGKPETNFTDKQWESLATVIYQLKALYPDAKVRGHCDFDKGRACPTFDVEKWWKTKMNQTS